MIEAKVICDSIGDDSPRLVTMRCRYPKFVHAEHLRHRSVSFSVSSNRAVPVAKNLEEVRSDELRAAPVWWGREQKGMQSGEELDDVEEGLWGSPYQEAPHTRRKYAQQRWKRAAELAAISAKELECAGAHKSIVNRLLEPFLHVNVIVTGCEPGWLNFFGLRLDRAAQPEMRVLAEAMWREWNESEPRKLLSGEWHLPLLDNETMDLTQFVWEGVDQRSHQNPAIAEWRKISAARCARTSYLSHATGRRVTIEEDLALTQCLIVSRHWSPFEHQAMPDEYGALGWSVPEQHGNLPGWRQFRKFFPGEAIAPLPDQFR